MRKLKIIFILLILSFSFVNCMIAILDYSAPRGGISFGVFNRLISFKQGGSISVRNIRGDVVVYGWENNKVEIKAERKLMETTRSVRLMWWKSILPDININHFDDFISIRTQNRQNDEYSFLVDYELRVPQAIIIDEISTQDGNIYIYDCFGEINLETYRGDIEVDNYSGSMRATVGMGSISTWLYDLRAEDEINLFIEEGNINIYLQEGVQANIEASAEKGEIISDFDFSEYLPSQAFSGKIGEKDGVSIILNALNGNIYIGKIKE